MPEPSAHATEEGRRSGTRSVWLRLGCVEETLRVANDSSGRSYELASYALPAEDTLELYAGWLAASLRLSSGKAEAKDMAAVLAGPRFSAGASPAGRRLCRLQAIRGGGQSSPAEPDRWGRTGQERQAIR